MCRPNTDPARMGNTMATRTWTKKERKAHVTKVRKVTAEDKHR